MNQLPRLVALSLVFAFASMAWLVLGGVTSARTSDQESALYGAVADLWGQPHAQVAPGLRLAWQVPVLEEQVIRERGEVVYAKDGTPATRSVTRMESRSRDEDLDSSEIAVDLHLDQRRKGLMWFPLYDVGFQGDWTWTHDGPEQGSLAIRFEFPVSNGVYDQFRFVVDGVDRASDVKPSGGSVEVSVPVEPGQTVAFSIGYRSRGMTEWVYRPTRDYAVGQLSRFHLAMDTDFRDIDFPSFTMSPSSKEIVGSGWKLDWDFQSLVTGHGIGMVMPERVQPGPLAAAMSFSAPISLGLFMLWIYVLGLLKGIEVHPVNHLFLAGAFFSFHLLFAYSADHLPVEAAFALSSAVSVLLVVTYLRLVVGNRFAFVEAGAAQLLYLVGFSLAHFWEGYTGLTVTVLGIVTLFALMQLTARIRWQDVFASDGRALADIAGKLGVPPRSDAPPPTAP